MRSLIRVACRAPIASRTISLSNLTNPCSSSSSSSSNKVFISSSYFIRKQSFHSSRVASFGFEEFMEPTKSKATDVFVSGRSWTVADLRRKNFDDLHKLWFILYKERNLLLSEREKSRRGQRPVSTLDENRYTKVKRSMGAIKHVLKERSKIKKILAAEEGFVSGDNTQAESIKTEPIKTESKQKNA